MCVMSSQLIGVARAACALVGWPGSLKEIRGGFLEKYLESGGWLLKEKEERKGAQHKSAFFFLLRTQTEQGRGLTMEALAPALQGTAAAGAWGKTERRSWGSDSLTHLGRRWSEEGWRRWWAEVAGYGRGGGAADLGKGRAVVEMVAVA